MNHPSNPIRAFRRVSLLSLLALVNMGTAQVAPPAEDSPEKSSKLKEEVLVMNPFEVKATSNVGYRADATSSSGRLAQAYIDIPQTVDVVTAEFMQDFNLSDSRKALSYVPSVFITSLINDGVTAIRGTTVNAVYFDGIASSGGAFGGYTFPAEFYDRLEVVKGPSSAAFGLGQPGGIINFITKKPLGKKRTELTLSIGDHNNYRSVLDTQGVSANNKFSYRLVLGGSTGDDAVNVLHTKSIGAQLALKYQATPRDTVQLIASYNNITIPYAQTPAWFHTKLGAQANGYLPYPGQPDPAIALPALVPKDEWSIAPGWNDAQARAFRANLIYDHQFSDRASIRNSLVFDNIKMDFKGFLTAGALSNPSPDLYRIPALLIWWPYSGHSVRDTLDFVAKYDAFGANMTTLIGGEGYKFKSDGNFQIGLPFNDDFSAYAVNIYNGRVNATSPGSPRQYLGKLAFAGLPEWISTKSLLDDNTGYGFYLQQEARFMEDKLTLMGAWRIDYLDYKNTNRNSTPNTVTAPGWQNTGGAPRAAITYKPRPWLSFYALYTEHKDPTKAQSRWNWGGGSVPPPTNIVADPNEVLFLQPKGYTDEFGVKALLLDDKVGVSVAVFKAVNSGQTIPSNNGQHVNPDGTTTFWSENTEVSSNVKGIEVTVAGQIGRRLVMTASYALANGTAPGTSTDAAGNSFGFVKYIDPPTTLSMHGKYDFGQGGKGLYATFGVIGYGPFWFVQQKSNNGGPPLNFYWDTWQYTADVGLGYIWGEKRKQHLVFSANNVTNQLVSLGGFVSDNYSELPLRRLTLSYSVEF